MQTDFAAIRQYLEAAWLLVHGDDDVANRVRDRIDQLIEIVAVEECSRPAAGAEVLAFRRRPA